MIAGAIFLFIVWYIVVSIDDAYADSIKEANDKRDKQKQLERELERELKRIAYEQKEHEYKVKHDKHLPIIVEELNRAAKEGRPFLLSNYDYR